MAAYKSELKTNRRVAALPRRDIYFLHIEKTAGSSLGQLIRSAYPVKAVLPVFRCEQLARLPLKTIRRCHCFTGHFGTALYSLLDRPISTITVLRDPFERTISHLGLMHRDISDYASFLDALPAEIRNELGPVVRGDLAECINSPFVMGALANYQTRILGTDIDLKTRRNPERPIHWHLMEESFSDADMPAIFERAKWRLAETLVTGTVERFEETVDLVCKALGVNRPAETPHVNVTNDRRVEPSYRNSGNVPDDQKQRVDQILAYDRLLYDFADVLLTQRMSERK